eukprot:27095-Prorocentrum_minimum.AAC.1
MSSRWRKARLGKFLKRKRSVQNLNQASARDWGNKAMIDDSFLDDARPPPTDPRLAALGLSDRLARPGNVKEDDSGVFFSG